MPTRNPAQGLPDCRVFGVERMPVDAAGTRDCRDAATQGWQRIAFAGRRQIRADDLRRGRHRLEPVPLAPGGVEQVDRRVGPQRRRRAAASC